MTQQIVHFPCKCEDQSFDPQIPLKTWVPWQLTCGPSTWEAEISKQTSQTGCKGKIQI